MGDPTRDGWGTGLWHQAKKVRLQRDGTLRAPVKVDGKDGIRVGDPPFDVTSGSGRRRSRPGLLARLRRLLGIG